MENMVKNEFIRGIICAWADMPDEFYKEVYGLELHNTNLELATGYLNSCLEIESHSR